MSENPVQGGVMSEEEHYQTGAALLGYYALANGINAEEMPQNVTECGHFLFDHGFSLYVNHGLPIDVQAELCVKHGMRFNFWQFYKDARMEGWTHSKVRGVIFFMGDYFYDRIYGKGHGAHLRSMIDAAESYWEKNLVSEEVESVSSTKAKHVFRWTELRVDAPVYNVACATGNAIIGAAQTMHEEE